MNDNNRVEKNEKTKKSNQSNEKLVNYENHRYREDLGGEHRWGDLIQLIFMFIFLVIWVWDSFFFQFWPVLSNFISLYISVPLGVMILGVSWYYGRMGLHIVFGEIRDPPVVIREGPFDYCRHPIYLAAIFMYLGFVVMTFSPLSFLVWITIIIMYLYLGEGEEKMLLDKFGEEYERYMDEVPKWIPHLTNEKGEKP